MKENANQEVMFKLKHKNKIEQLKSQKNICSYEGCSRQVQSKLGKYCEKHISMVDRNIKIHEIIDELEIESITKMKSNKIIKYKNVKFFALVIIDISTKLEKVTVLIDISDYNSILKCTWNLLNNGYIYTRINKKVYLLHRFVLNYEDPEMEVDHIDRNKLDNRKENLRICTISQNRVNIKQLSNNTSGVTGVTWDKSRDKWKASLNINSKSHYLGRYNTIEEAEEARLSAEKLLHNEFIPIERRCIA